MKSFIYLFFCFGSLFTFAGTAVSGGGGAIVCTSKDGKIKSAQVFDLFEGEILYGLPKFISTNTLSHYLTKTKETLKNLSPNYSYIADLMDLVQSNIKYLPSGVHLTTVNDSNPTALPSGCELRQLAHYIDDSLVLIDSDIWTVLDDLNKAALIVHEAVYRFERGPDTVDSRHARKIVGHLLSDTILEPILEGVPDNPLFCWAFQKDFENSFSYTYKFYYLPIRNSSNVVLQFEYIHGLPLYSKTTVIVPAFWKIDSFDRVSTVTTSKFKDRVPLTFANYGYEYENKKSHIFLESSEGRFEIQCED